MSRSPSSIETVIITRRRRVDPAAPVIPHAVRAYDHIVLERVGPPRPRSYTIEDTPPAPSTTTPPLPTDAGGIFGAITHFAGPYALPVSEIAIGAWFAVSQIQHVVERVAPGAAQLWRADGSGGPLWHVVAALAGLAAAVHGIVSVVHKVRAKKAKPT